MIDLLLWLIYLLKFKYLNNKCMLRHGRQRFRVNIGFSDKDGIFDRKSVRFKHYETEKLIKEFLSKGWGTVGM